MIISEKLRKIKNLKFRFLKILIFCNYQKLNFIINPTKYFEKK